MHYSIEWLTVLSDRQKSHYTRQVLLCEIYAALELVSYKITVVFKAAFHEALCVR